MVALSRLAPRDCLEPPVPDPLDLVLPHGDLRTRDWRLWTRRVPRSPGLVDRSPSVRFPRPHDLRNRGTLRPPFCGSGTRASEPRNGSGHGRDCVGRDCPRTASTPDRRPTSLVGRGRVVRWPVTRDFAVRANRPASGSAQGGPALHRPSGCDDDCGWDSLSARGVLGICPRRLEVGLSPPRLLPTGLRSSIYILLDSWPSPYSASYSIYSRDSWKWSRPPGG